MRIAIIALGTRGDVQPYVALGKGLQEAGNSVRLVTHQNFEGLVKAHGLEFWAMRGNVQDVAESQEMRVLLEKGRFLAITLRAAKEAQRVSVEWARDGLAACQGMEMVVAGIGGLHIALALAEKLEILFVQAYVVPFTPTKAFPGVLFPQSLPKWAGFLNRLSHDLIRQMMWQGFRAADQQVRRTVLKVPASPFWGPYNTNRLQHAPVLYGISPSVLLKPSDWDHNTHITGYWFLDSEDSWTPPPKLTDFLQAGVPPIYIGFGSMGSRKPEETADLILQALAKTDQRAILLSGWGGLHKSDLPNTVLMVDSLPHAWLFPRVAAVIHHGGAGTTAAGLRAGVPSIIIPFFGDQSFWGQRVASLGVGVKPIPRQKLTIERLGQAIQTAVTDQKMRQSAANLGEKIRVEDGITRAVALIQQHSTKI